MANLVPVIEQVKLIMVDAKAKVADNEGWDTGDFKDIYDAFVDTVIAVEAASEEIGGLTEAEKKEAVSETLNWLIDVPWVPEALEGVAFDLVVGLVWEAAKGKISQFKLDI